MWRIIVEETGEQVESGDWWESLRTSSGWMENCKSREILWKTVTYAKNDGCHDYLCKGEYKPVSFYSQHSLLKVKEMIKQ